MVGGGPTSHEGGETLPIDTNGNQCVVQHAHLRSGGVVGYHVCLTRTRSRVRSSSRVLPFFAPIRTIVQAAVNFILVLLFSTRQKCDTTENETQEES